MTIECFAANIDTGTADITHFLSSNGFQRLQLTLEDQNISYHDLQTVQCDAMLCNMNFSNKIKYVCIFGLTAF